MDHGWQPGQFGAEFRCPSPNYPKTPRGESLQLINRTLIIFSILIFPAVSFTEDQAGPRDAPTPKLGALRSRIGGVPIRAGAAQPNAESACGQKLVDGATPPSTVFYIYPRQPLQPFYQWENNDGYCGEVSMMQAGLNNGQWMSQFNARLICGAGLSQPIFSANTSSSSRRIAPTRCSRATPRPITKRLRSPLSSSTARICR